MVGFTATVSNTYGRGLQVRAGPGQGHEILTVLHEGTKVRVLNGPVAGDQYTWYEVGDADGEEFRGWSAGEYLTPDDEVRWSMVPELEPDSVFAQRRLEKIEGRTLVVRCTAYSNAENGLWGPYTKLGTPTRWGVVAVDPSVIPLGSRVRIEGFDTEFVAEDTGGGIVGAWVDIWFPDYYSALAFGVSYREVVILDP